jgi:hypothetical protein
MSCQTSASHLISQAVPQFLAQCPDAFVAEQRIQRGSEDNGVFLVRCARGDQAVAKARTR